MQLDFDAQQFLLFVFLDGADVDPRPARHHFFDVLARDDSGAGVVELQTLANDAQIFFFFAFFLGIEARLLEFVIGDGGFHAVGDEFHAFLHFCHFIRQHGLAQFYARARFVDQVDSLVREETIGNVTAGKINRVTNGFVGVADGMEFFVTFAHAL